MAAWLVRWLVDDLGGDLASVKVEMTVAAMVVQSDGLMVDVSAIQKEQVFKI